MKRQETGKATLSPWRTTRERSSRRRPSGSRLSSVPPRPSQRGAPGGPAAPLPRGLAPPWKHLQVFLGGTLSGSTPRRSLTRRRGTATSRGSRPGCSNRRRRHSGSRSHRPGSAIGGSGPRGARRPGLPTAPLRRGRQDAALGHATRHPGRSARPRGGGPTPPAPAAARLKGNCWGPRRSCDRPRAVTRLRPPTSRAGSPPRPCARPSRKTRVPRPLLPSLGPARVTTISVPPCRGRHSAPRQLGTPPPWSP